MTGRSDISFDEFSSLARDFTVVPVSSRMLADTLTPVSAYLRLREGSRSSFLFESVEGGERFARYSFIGREPIALVRCRDRHTAIVENGSVRESTENFFSIVDELIGRYRQPSIPKLPRFTGGLVGFIGYDAVRFIERVPCTVDNDAGIDDSVLGLFASIVVFDHLKHHVITIVNVLIDRTADLRSQYDRACEAIDRIERMLVTPLPVATPFRACLDRLEQHTSRQDFEAKVVKAKRHIREGDIFQVVLSQRFAVEYTGDPFNAYRALRIVNPSPYLYYLDLDGFQIVGSSPEILVRMESQMAEVYPIAGTRRRGETDEEDRALEAELLADEKERAEHVMLLDLGRNDLGRVCSTGSVRVDQLMTVVRYSHVMHIASRIVGLVRDGTSCVEVLKATFPAGTVSGAPKIRAMEIIDSLESTRRGIYAGGVGYFDFSGNMDFCIAIRTMYTREGRMYLQSGAGIVADSDPAREYEETINKARALVEALRLGGAIVR